MKALKAFIKSFGAPQRSVKIKKKFSSSGIGTGSVKEKQCFIDFHRKSEFDYKTSRWVGQDIGIRMTLSVEKIDM